MSVSQHFDSFFNTFHFGKHRDEALIDVIEEDPEYVRWCIDEGVIEGTDNYFRDRLEKEMEKHE